MKNTRYIRYFFIIFFSTFLFFKNISYGENLQEINLYSESCILIEANTGTILYGKNENEKMFPASTTKILTAIIAIEKCNLDDAVIVQKSAISSIPAGYSSAYLSEGEQVTVRDLLQVFLIHSANEAGYVLAEHISGSVSNFADLMNSKSKEIGCTNSNFVNPSGIHNENHYTTAEDLAKIASYCMKNKTFRSIVSMKKCTIAPTNKSDSRTYKNTNDLINPSSKYYTPECIGIKTGYTSEAKNCLVAGFTKNGLNLISIVLGAPTIQGISSTRCVDSITLCKYGYSNYEMKKFATKGETISSIDIKNGSKETRTLDLILENDVKLLSKADSSESNLNISLKENLHAPIKANDIVGTATYTSCGTKVTVNLLASHDVKETIIIKLILLLITLIFIIVLVLIITKKIKNKEAK